MQKYEPPVTGAGIKNSIEAKGKTELPGVSGSLEFQGAGGLPTMNPSSCFCMCDSFSGQCSHSLFTQIPTHSSQPCSSASSLMKQVLVPPALDAPGPCQNLFCKAYDFRILHYAIYVHVSSAWLDEAAREQELCCISSAPSTWLRA